MKNMDLRDVKSRILRKGILIIGLLTLIYFMVLELIVLYEAGYDSILKSFRDLEIVSALILSIVTSTISSLITMVLIIPLVYLHMNVRKRNKQIIEGVFNCINSIPPIILGLSILILFGKNYLGAITQVMGVRILFTKFAIIIAQSAVILPMGFIEYAGVVKSIDERYIVTAKGYGADELFIYFKIIIPETYNNIRRIIVVMWSKAIGHFGAVVMVVGVTRFDTEVLPSSVFLNISCGDLSKSLAAASIMIIISNLISIVLSNGRIVEN